MIYRMLVLNLGEPPVRFTWTRRDAEGRPVDTREYTPRSFFETYVADDLTGNYVMLMNDPTRDYYKCYEIDYDRHVYDGRNWTYVNLPVEEIKRMAVASIRDSTMMYCSTWIISTTNRSWALPSAWTNAVAWRVSPADRAMP